MRKSFSEHFHSGRVAAGALILAIALIAVVLVFSP